MIIYDKPLVGWLSFVTQTRSTFIGSPRSTDQKGSKWLSVQEPPPRAFPSFALEAYMVM